MKFYKTKFPTLQCGLQQRMNIKANEICKISKNTFINGVHYTTLQVLWWSITICALCEILLIEGAIYVLYCLLFLQHILQQCITIYYFHHFCHFMHKNTTLDNDTGLSCNNSRIQICVRNFLTI